MAVFAVTNTFVSGASITASGHNVNWSDLSTWLNNRYNGVDTWLFMKVNSTNSNPVDITSSGVATELSLNNTATDGDVQLTFKLSGSQTHIIGVDDSDFDILKCGTTSITSGNAWQVTPQGVFSQQSLISISSPTSLSDNVSTTGKMWFNNNSGGALTINGFTNGTTGQVLYIFNIDAAANVTLTNNNAGGTQKILTPGGGSIVLGPRRGCTLIFDPSGFWVFVGTTS